MSTNPFQPPGAVPPLRPLRGPGAGLTENRSQLWAVDVYSDAVDLDQTLTPELREAYKHNLLTPGMPAWAFVFLSVITFGVFPTVYLQLKQSKLPAVKRDDPSAGKAIGFMFIPLFNLYWYFVVWSRLVDRVNFQYRLRGKLPPIARGQVMTAQVLAIAGWFLFGIVGIAGCIWLLVLGAQIESASNQLAEGKV